ncbi:MAG TPA: O-antigen ligase family protein [Pyrinomonadaceae bacterium]|jgi:O-antigen ligase
MEQTATLELRSVRDDSRAQLRRVATFFSRTIFFSLLSLIVLTAIPYGTSQPWWIAAFVAAVFAVTILWLVEGYLSRAWFAENWPVVLPVVSLAGFAFLQTLNFGNQTFPAGIRFAIWNSISADPYQTRFFVLLLLALALLGVMLSRHASSEKRLRILINLIICVAVASAVFGIVRQTTQHGKGFGLPLLIRGLGFGQFINKNHFAFLMEMALGLVLGLILGRGIKREQTLIYLAALLPLWTGLLLCGSRGGLIAMAAQLLVAALLYSSVRKASERDSELVRVARSLPVRIALMSVLVLGVGIGTVWLGGDQLATKIEDSRRELNTDTSESRQGASRNEIWRATWKTFVAHPIVGVGMAGYWAAIPAYHDASGSLTPQEAHNDYLELLASGGLVGFALGVWFVVIVVRRTRENLRTSNPFQRAACFGATVGLIGVAIHSLVDFGLHTIVNAIVFTTLIVIVTSKPRRENSRARSI